MAKYKVEVDKETCIGCSACVAACDNFVMDDSVNIAVPVKKEIDEDEYKVNKEAEEICPVQAIKVAKKA
ncbi:ferredoxin [Candidatus Woesearchaeota archaeon]|nr:ferredoxin [Candidatus Woesearchaeota archaeon]